jgi:2,3-bisphosphoglycerate-dependent phosphoglycerate mutase
MTRIYFVRHAQPQFGWMDDRTRPLTSEGKEDSRRVADVLKNIRLDYAISSPYLRSMDTIRECAADHNLELHTEERYRERQSGVNGNGRIMIRKRWENFDYHEENGESIRMVQQRNIEALFELLKDQSGKNIILGTHGTALSTILNFYDPAFHCDSFFRIINYMPYITRLDFEGTKCIKEEEILIIEKEFK